jgi:hypothetical protein
MSDLPDLRPPDPPAGAGAVDGRRNGAAPGRSGQRAGPARAPFADKQLQRRAAAGRQVILEHYGQVDPYAVLSLVIWPSEKLLELYAGNDEFMR